MTCCSKLAFWRSKIVFCFASSTSAWRTRTLASESSRSKSVWPTFTTSPSSTRNFATTPLARASSSARFSASSVAVVV
jgi:hypothetical protein